MNSTSEIFVSYAHLNESYAATVREILEQISVTYWIDRSKLVGGDVWNDEIRHAIEGCHLLILVATPESLRSIEV